jgi:hypothetical protein
MAIRQADQQQPHRNTQTTSPPATRRPAAPRAVGKEEKRETGRAKQTKSQRTSSMLSRSLAADESPGPGRVHPREQGGYDE